MLEFFKRKEFMTENGPRYLDSKFKRFVEVSTERIIDNVRARLILSKRAVHSLFCTHDWSPMQIGKVYERVHISTERYDTKHVAVYSDTLLQCTKCKSVKK